MKNLLLTFFLINSILLAEAQNTVRIKGQIDHFNPTEFIYLGAGEAIITQPLIISANGSFSVDVNVQELPSFVTFNKIAKNGKIEAQLPRIWFQSDTITIRINWSNKSFQSENLLPFQEISEKIETMNGHTRVNYILQHANQLPCLYYAHRYKEDFSLADLETFMERVPAEFKKLMFAKKIDNYLLAAKLGPVKIGDRLKDFSLTGKEGNLVSVLPLTNKPKLITLFSSGCQYSGESIDLLAALNEQNNGKLEITTIWTDGSRETWLNAYGQQKAKITWTNLWDEFGFAATYLDLKIWPTFYVINEAGILTDKFHSGKSTEKKLKKLME